MFPEPQPLSGKRLVPSLAVGCVVFALIGLLGTYFLGSALQGFFHADRDKLAKQAEANEERAHEAGRH